MFLLAEATPDVSNWLPTIGAICSTGFTVWYAYYTITTSIPDLMKQHREERKELVQTCKELTEQFTNQLDKERVHREAESKANREMFKCPMSLQPPTKS